MKNYAHIYIYGRYHKYHRQYPFCPYLWQTQFYSGWHSKLNTLLDITRKQDHCNIVHILYYVDLFFDFAAVLSNYVLQKLVLTVTYHLVFGKENIQIPDYENNLICIHIVHWILYMLHIISLILSYRCGKGWQVAFNNLETSYCPKLSSCQVHKGYTEKHEYIFHF